MREYSKVGSILNIVCGGFGILMGIVLIAMIAVLGFIFTQDMFGPEMPREMANQFVTMMGVVYGTMGVIILLAGVLGIVGGVYGLKKKYWGLSLAASIAGTMTFYVCGIIALIFIALAKNEFNKPIQPEVSQPVAQPLQPPQV